MPDLTILMPVYNERSTVEEAIERALSAPLPVESRQLVVVDDGSTDGTRELLRGRDWPPEVEIVYHERNGGKGVAVRTAIEHAQGRWAAILDADLEYDPADIGRLLEPLQAGEAEVVFGVRGFDSRSAFSFWYVMGNRAVTMVANVIFNSWLADIMTCHKAMATDVWRSLDLRARGFELEGEITGRVLASGRRPYEVPITYIARGREDGKKLTGMDALRVVVTLFRVRLRALVIPLPVRMLLALVALGLAVFMGLQVSAEKRLKDSRDTVNEVRQRGDPRREEAIRTLLDVADVQPGTEALLLASTARSSRDQDRAGAALARRAVDREPDNFAAWITLGFALKDIDRPAALDALERARRLNPRYRIPRLR